MEIGDGVRFRACSLYDDTMYPATSARMEATSEARKGLMLPQGNSIGPQGPMVQQCTDTPSAAMQRGQWGFSLAAEPGIDSVGTYELYRKIRSLPQGSTFEPQGSRPQQCETGRGQFSTEVSVMLAALQEKRAKADSRHYMVTEVGCGHCVDTQADAEELDERTSKRCEITHQQGSDITLESSDSTPRLGNECGNTEVKSSSHTPEATARLTKVEEAPARERSKNCGIAEIGKRYPGVATQLGEAAQKRTIEDKLTRLQPQGKVEITEVQDSAVREEESQEKLDCSPPTKDPCETVKITPGRWADLSATDHDLLLVGMQAGEVDAPSDRVQVGM